MAPKRLVDEDGKPFEDLGGTILGRTWKLYRSGFNVKLIVSSSTIGQFSRHEHHTICLRRHDCRRALACTERLESAFSATSQNFLPLRGLRMIAPPGAGIIIEGEGARKKAASTIRNCCSTAHALARLRVSAAVR